MNMYLLQHSRLNEYVSIVTELYSYTHSVGLLLYEYYFGR